MPSILEARGMVRAFAAERGWEDAPHLAVPKAMHVVQEVAEVCEYWMYEGENIPAVVADRHDEIEAELGDTLFGSLRLANMLGVPINLRNGLSGSEGEQISTLQDRVGRNMDLSGPAKTPQVSRLFRILVPLCAIAESLEELDEAQARAEVEANGQGLSLHLGHLIHNILVVANQLGVSAEAGFVRVHAKIQVKYAVGDGAERNIVR